uniref:Integrase core domain containing protein n=1 Tax=Solanum tuberosum TaxID=4113 RepID=M1DDB4_SOLTU
MPTALFTADLILYSRAPLTETKGEDETFSQLAEGYTFVVTSSLMQMLIVRGLFLGLPSKDPHAHIAKLRVVCKSCVGRPDLDMDIIGLRVFPLSLTVSKKLNHKDKVNNFVALPGESVTSSWDRFTGFIRGVPNHHIDDESLKEYFYRGQDDNNKAVLDTIAGGSYVNPHQPGTLPRNTIQNPKNHGHCMEVTTRGGKQTIDPPIPSMVDVEIRKEDDVVEAREESENAIEKEAEISQKVVHIPRSPPPFPQRLVKKTEDGKYRRFITMLKQLSINVPLIEALELMSGVESGTEVQIEKRLGVEALAAVMMNFDSDGIEEYDELVAALDRCEYRSKPKKYELDMKNR